VHGGWEHVRRCLDSLLVQTVPCRIIVVDDVSPDDTLERLRSRYADLDIIANDVNSGFATSCNKGIRAGDAEVVILLNSDVVAKADLVASILDVFDEDRDGSVGSVSPLLLDADGTVDSFGVTADRTIAGFVRFHGAGEADIDGNSPRLLGPYGAVAGYRRRALDQVGLLDENIFMYGEELDLALRLRAAGWGAAGIPHAVGTHVGGATAGRGSKRQRYLAGFGRGYLLRVYGILRRRHAIQVFVTETAAALVDSLHSRDLAAVRGRLAGWRRGRGVPRRPVPAGAIDPAIGFRRSIDMRRPDYWRTRSR
jgi:GT2 family glycosyltransferase